MQTTIAAVLASPRDFRRDWIRAEIARIRYCRRAIRDRAENRAYCAQALESIRVGLADLAAIIPTR